MAWRKVSRMCSQQANGVSSITGQSKLSKFAVFVWFFIVSILTLPLGGMIPSPGIDNSCAIALNMALSRGMQFGKDIVFVFGPLGFLYLPSFCDINHWIIAYLSGLLVHFVLMLLVFLLLSKVAGSKLYFVLASAALLFILPFLLIDYKLLLIAFLLLNSVLTFQDSSKRSCLIIIVMSLCMALSSNIKYSAIISSAGVVSAVAIIFVYQRQFLKLATVILSYPIAFMGIWTLTGQNIENFMPCMRNIKEIFAGYNRAMMLSGETPQLLAGITGTCLFYLLFAYGAITKKRGLIVFMAPFLVFVFMMFKHGFVRHDLAHVYVFFAIMLFLFGWVYLAYKQNFPKLLRVLLLILCCVMAFFTITQDSHVSQSIPQRLKSNLLALKVLVNDSVYRQNLLRGCKLYLQNEFNLSNDLVEYIGRNRVDIIPYEINLLYAYDMNWSPSPVFQSHSAYTKTLDLLNAGYYRQNTPDMLFYTVWAIDDRYAVFDEPAAFREILTNYKPLFDGRILVRKSEPASFQKHTIAVIEADIGEVIQIPQASGYLFANIAVEDSLLGKAAAIAYKGDEMRVHLVTDEKSFEHRFIPSAAKNGVFLSSYISDNQDLSNVFDGRAGKTIRSLRLTTGKRWFYSDKIKIEFFEMYSNSSIVPDQSLSPPLESK